LSLVESVCVSRQAHIYVLHMQRYKYYTHIYIYINIQICTHMWVDRKRNTRRSTKLNFR
jgi:hypothetical protein